MAYVIGALGAVLFFALLGGAYYIGTRHKQRKNPQPMNEQQKRRAEELQRYHSEIMSYDVDKARGGTT